MNPYSLYTDGCAIRSKCYFFVFYLTQLFPGVCSLRTKGFEIFKKYITAPNQIFYFYLFFSQYLYIFPRAICILFNRFSKI